MATSNRKWCAFSGSYDCPIRNKEDAYCKESLLLGCCKRKHPESTEHLNDFGAAMKGGGD